jgi:hypothetical protein
MKILVICRPREDVDPQAEIAPRAAAEMETLRELRNQGPLLEAYSPGGPGAILIFDGIRVDVDRALKTLPLVHDGIIETEIIELQPFAALNE